MSIAMPKAIKHTYKVTYIIPSMYLKHMSLSNHVITLETPIQVVVISLIIKTSHVVLYMGLVAPSS